MVAPEKSMSKYWTIIEARPCKVGVIPIIGNGDEIGKPKGVARKIAEVLVVATEVTHGPRKSETASEPRGAAEFE